MMIGLTEETSGTGPAASNRTVGDGAQRECPGQQAGGFRDVLCGVRWDLRPRQIGLSGDSVLGRTRIGLNPVPAGWVQAGNLAEVLDGELELRMGRRRIEGQVARVLGQWRAKLVSQSDLAGLSNWETVKPSVPVPAIDLSAGTPAITSGRSG